MVRSRTIERHSCTGKLLRRGLRLKNVEKGDPRVEETLDERVFSADQL